MAINLDISDNRERIPLSVQSNTRLRSVNADNGSPYYVGARAYVTQTDNGAVVTVIDKDGTTTATILNGQDGTDGYTPVKGVDYFDGEDGQDGYAPIKGVDYFDGSNGQDGYSPTATVSKSGGTSTITITDKNGTTTAEVYDGTNGVADVQVDGTSVVTGGVAEIDLSGKADTADLAAVATSGSYNDLSNKPTIPSGVEKSTTTPKMDGTAAIGSETKFAAGDHVHPTDTSRQADLGLTSNDVTKWNNAIGYGYNSHTPEAYVRGFDEDTERDIVRIKHGTTTSIGNTDIPTKAYVDGAFTTAASQFTELLNGKVNVNAVGAANGVAPLDANSKIDSQYLPSYVDDVIEAYPVSGATALSAGWLSGTSGGSALTPEAGKIYVLMADSGDYSANTQFRWGGTTYVKLSDGGVSSITNAEIDTIVAS